MGELGKEDNDATLNISVKDVSGNLTQFKIKKETKLGKVMNAYAQKMGVALDSIRFFFDGRPIDKDSTPKMMEMENDDQIDVFLQQTGGRVCTCSF